MLNNCILTGNLGADPEIFYSSDGEPVANFCLEKNLNTHEVIDMIDGFTDEEYSCECGLLEDEKILELIGKQKPCLKTHSYTSKASVK
jgi:hypothetical protein